jgi:hypothetical protein
MNTLKPYRSIVSILTAGACALTLAATASAENESADNAQSFLESVKKRELERQMAAKQTELNRLAEDVEKEKKEAETMQANIAATGDLHKESTSQLEKLGAQKKRMEQVLELTRMRIEAEALKAEGLKMLADAQGKTLAALNKRAEETQARIALGAAELKQLSPGTFEPNEEAAGKQAGKGQTTVGDLRKKLAASVSLSASAERIAREAMTAASSKLDLANAAGGKAKKKAANVEGDLPPIADKPLDLEEKAPDKASEDSEQKAPAKAKRK